MTADRQDELEYWHEKLHARLETITNDKDKKTTCDAMRTVAMVEMMTDDY